MFRRRSSAHSLKAELAEVEALIAAHPLATQPVRAAHELIETNGGRSPEEIDRVLAEGGLPSAHELGRVQVAGTWSWWRLHRRKREVRQRIERIGGS